MNNEEYEKIRPKDYCDIDLMFSKGHLLTLIKWIYAEVLSAGGDGDAIWYSKHYGVDEIFELVKEFNDSNSWKWEVSLDSERKRINWWCDQSSILITNNKEDFDNRPSWQQCSVVL